MLNKDWGGVVSDLKRELLSITRPMKDTMVRLSTIYSHEKYGDVLVVNIVKEYTSYDTMSDDNEGSGVHVRFSDQFDAYGSLGTSKSEPIEQFVANASFVRSFDYQSF